MDTRHHSTDSSLAGPLANSSERLMHLVSSFRVLRSEVEQTIPDSPARSRALGLLQQSVIWARVGLEGPWTLPPLEEDASNRSEGSQAPGESAS